VNQISVSVAPLHSEAGGYVWESFSDSSSAVLTSINQDSTTTLLLFGLADKEIFCKNCSTLSSWATFYTRRGGPLLS